MFKNILKKIKEFYSKHETLMLHILAAIGAWLLAYICTILLKNWTETSVIELVKGIDTFIDRHQTSTHGILTLFVLFSLVVVIKVRRGILRGKIAKTAGLFLYSFNSTQKSLKDSEQYLKAAGKKTIYLGVLAATGWDTFGREGTPLHEAVRTCREIRVVLLDPLSKAVEIRSKALGIDAEDYRKDIHRSIEYLRTIKKKGTSDGTRLHGIRLKAYKFLPFWHFVILDNWVRVQQYPDNDYVKNSPYYAFEKGEESEKGGGMIFEHVCNEFNRYWDDDGRFIEYDFERGGFVREKESKKSTEEEKFTKKDPSIDKNKKKHHGGKHRRKF